ncbi:MAG: hypothetical protein RSA64_05475, partial [Christensenellaceae bacterium]
MQIIAPFASSPISVAFSLIFTMKKPPCLEWHQCFLFTLPTFLYRLSAQTLKKPLLKNFLSVTEAGV